MHDVDQDMRLQVLSELNWWTLLFSQVFTFTEVWGARPGGLTVLDQREIELAWDEHHMMTEEERTTNQRAEKDPDAKEFDRVKYLGKRITALEGDG